MLLQSWRSSSYYFKNFTPQALISSYETIKNRINKSSETMNNRKMRYQ